MKYMENYICINGKNIELTEEQVKQLTEPKESPFERVRYDESYYYIGPDGVVKEGVERGNSYNATIFGTANYCTDWKLMKQRALHETLNRLLWRYSMTHGGGKDSLKANTFEWCVAYDSCEQLWYAGAGFEGPVLGCVYFESEAVARAAIKEVVEPFIAKHPDFEW